jgi:hypothetical protein
VKAEIKSRENLSEVIVSKLKLVKIGNEVENEAM